MSKLFCRARFMPNGLLRNKKDGREYSYLFWEGEKKQTNAQTIYEDGFIVHKDKVVEFLQKILPEFGLTPYEYNEFIVFWTPYLMQNEWNFIYFRFGENYDEISKNIVHPKPQTIIRVFMVLLPIGIFLTYKAVVDATLFNPEMYVKAAHAIKKYFNKLVNRSADEVLEET